MSRKSYINASKMLKKCRVCLTQSNTKMYDLKEDLKLTEYEKQTTILEALEKIVSVKILLDEDFPECICPMCISILKMSFKFILQFEESQRMLSQAFNKESFVMYRNSDRNKEVTKAAESQEESNASVEIIFGASKYDIKDLLVVEETPSERDNFDGFLNNLGREVSASFTDKSKSMKSNVKADEDDEITIYMNDHEHGILPVKELKIDDESNVIDYIVVEKEETMQSTGDVEYIEFEAINEEDVDSILITDSNKQRCGKDKGNNLREGGRGNEKKVKVGKRKKNNISEINSNDIVIMAPDDIDAEEWERLGKENSKTDVEGKSNNVTIMTPESIGAKKGDCEKDDEFEREVQFACEICKKTFPNPKSLAAHKKRHQPSSRQFTCHICGYKNQTRSGYIHHQNKHKGKHFTCEICNKKYYTKAVLKVHMASHTNKRQHLCQVCGNGFNYANALVYHMRLHTGEKNYACRFCGERFRMPNGLIRHERTHTGEKPYQCRFCDKAFCSKGEVQCHENIHTGYRPYHCKYCRKGFTKTHNLKLHLLQHDGPHKCDICYKSFIEMAILAMHYKVAHKDLLDELEEEEEEIVEIEERQLETTNEWK